MGNPATITIVGTVTGEAIFEINTYELTLEATGLGTTLKNPDKSGYEHGDKVTVTASPQIGWHYLGWYEEGKLLTEENSIELTMEGTRTLRAFFEINTYELTLESNWKMETVGKNTRPGDNI